jgi:succinate dehydrogenase / fumarate reductase flavoprotein subunit
MSESLRNDGRVWTPLAQGESRAPAEIPADERDYFLERQYPSFGNLVPRDVASRSTKERCDAGYGVGPTGQAVYLDFEDAIRDSGKRAIDEKYGNIFTMYRQITDEDPYTQPMRIYPASHYTMGGLWVDYNLMSNIPGLFVIGEANFSDHGANRLGASALMQGLADGYFIVPYTVDNYLVEAGRTDLDTGGGAFRQDEESARDYYRSLVGRRGDSFVDELHHELGIIMWDHVGMVRSERSLKRALEVLPALSRTYRDKVRVPGGADNLNEQLEKAARVADFIDLAELMALDALHREESCGAHFREEHQTADHEPVRDDGRFQHVAVWQYREGERPLRHIEPLAFDNVTVGTRSYK